MIWNSTVREVGVTENRNRRETVKSLQSNLEQDVLDTYSGEGTKTEVGMQRCRKMKA